MNLKHNLIENNIIILSKQTLDEMLKDNNPSDLIGLYCFYYYTAKWQKTNTIKCSTGYVMKGLNWSKERTIKNKKGLKKLGLVSDKKTKNKKGQITGWYIKINYIWKKDTIKNQKVASPEGGLPHRVGNPDTNALSANSLNALSANSLNALSANSKVAKQGFARKDQVVFDLIGKFKNVNPSYKQLFKNKTERSALKRLLKEHGKEKVDWLLEVIPKTNNEQYAPTITKPLELENKLGKLLAFLKRSSKNKNNYIKI